MKIIVDAMGGDNAPQAPVMGAIQANKAYGVDITLVGRGEEILKVLKDNGIQDLPAGVEIAHASEVVEICDNPATAFREKKDSSLTVGLNLLKNGEGDAFVSAGSTGALLGAATLLIKRIKGIRRAALAPVVPTGNGGAILIDAGGQREVPAGVPDPVRLYGLLLRRACAGPPRAQGGPAEHRRGALQGHRSSDRGIPPAEKGRGGGPHQLRGQY